MSKIRNFLLAACMVAFSAFGQTPFKGVTVSTNVGVLGAGALAPGVKLTLSNGVVANTAITNATYDGAYLRDVKVAFVQNLQTLLSDDSPTVAKLAFVLEDDSNGDATRGTYRYDPTLSGPETATIWMCQDKGGNTSSLGRWVRMSAGDNYQMSVDTLDDALAVSPAYLAAGINPTNSLKMTVKTRARKAIGSGGGATYRYTTNYSGSTNLGVAVAYGSGHLVADTEDGVSVRLFGAKGDDSTDDVVALNDAILWGAQNKTPILIPEGRYRYSTPLLVHNNTTILSTPNGILRPNISGSDGSESYSFLRNTNLFSGIGPTPRTTVAALATNITLRGLRFEAVAGSSTNVRGITLIGARDVVLDDIEIDRTFDNWAFTFYAADLRASKLRVKNNQNVFEDGVHVLGGERMVFSDLQIQSGDDCFAIGWDSSDVFCRDIVVNGGTFKSFRAFPIKMFAPPEMTAGVTCQEKIIFNNIVGEGGINRNGGIFLYEQGTPRGAITNVTISNVKLRVNSGTHDGTNPYGVWLIGTSEVDLNNVSVLGNDSYSLIVDGLKGPLRVNGGTYATPENSSTEAVFVYNSYTNTATFNGVSIAHTGYRPFRSIESDIIINGGTISSGGAMHIGFQTATNATRSLRVSGATFTGSSTVPVQATGTSSNLLTYIATGNVMPTGSAVTGISASNYYQFGNTGMSVYDLFSNLRVNNLVATNATLGQSTGGTAANLIGGTGGARVLTMQRDSLSQSIGLGVGTDALNVWNETDNRGIALLSNDGTSPSLYIGEVSSATPPIAARIYGTAGSGTDVVGSGLSIYVDNSSGSANRPDAFSVFTGDAGSSGSSVQTSTEKFVVEGDGDVRFSNNIELGHASDTTLARSAAGVVSIEGNVVASPASPSTGTVPVWTNSAWAALPIVASSALSPPSVEYMTQFVQRIDGGTQYQDAWFPSGGGSGGGASLGTVADLLSHPGICRLNNGPVGSYGIASTALDAIRFSGGEYELEFCIYLPNLSDGTDTFTVAIGFIDALNADSVDGAWVKYSHGVNSGKFQAIAVNNTTATTSDLGVTVAATTWYRIKITVNAAGTSVTYTVMNNSGSTLGTATITTNIPTGSSRQTGAGVAMWKSVGTTARYTYIDWARIKLQPTP